MDHSTANTKKPTDGAAEAPLSAQEARMLAALRQIAKRAGRRPWTAVIRQVDGIVTVQEAGPPERIAPL